ncbi:hypothetical protein EBZ39_02620 [bacterium]|nr:hypothetical protein [bacterium]
MDTIDTAVAQAVHTIVANVSGPHFFEKLAAAGIHTRSEQEAAELWALGQNLLANYTLDQEKTAADQVSELAVANAQLSALLAARTGAPVMQEKEAAFRGMATAAANSPEVANAVLTLQAVQAAAAQAGRQ